MRILLPTVFLLSFLFVSCEDDPVVEPSNSGNTKSGSYARLSFPDSNQVKNSVNP